MFRVDRARVVGGGSQCLKPVPHSQWHNQCPPGLREVWLSRDFLVQVFEAPLPAIARLSVCRTKVGNDGRWKDGITWDELQRLKRECGRGSAWAVEVFPAEADVVNVANMRHLWVLASPPDYVWRA